MLSTGTSYRGKYGGKNSYRDAPRPKRNFPFLGMLRWGVGLALCCMLLLGLVVGAFQLYHYATTSDFFALKKIEIRGATNLTREAILAASGLHPQKNSLNVSIASVEQSLKANPMIESVAVKRRLPDTFEIRITERIPLFWILEGDVLHYADSNGALIAPVEAGNFLSLPTLEVLPGGETLRGRVGELMASLHAASLPLDISAISTIRLSSAKGVELFIENRKLTVCISPTEWNDNIARLQQVLVDLAHRGELKNTQEIWASDDSVWVVSNQ